MKKISLLILLLIIIGNYSCERDDLCSETTPTTPSLIIRLYDISNQESNKNAFNLRVQGLDNLEVLEDYNIVTSDSLVLPLKTDGSLTEYKLHKDYAFDDNGTPDDPSDDIFAETLADVPTVEDEDVFAVDEPAVFEEPVVEMASAFGIVFLSVHTMKKN